MKDILHNFSFNFIESLPTTYENEFNTLKYHFNTEYKTYCSLYYTVQTEGRYLVFTIVLNPKLKNCQF